MPYNPSKTLTISVFSNFTHLASSFAISDKIFTRLTELLSTELKSNASLITFFIVFDISLIIFSQTIS